MDKSDEPHYPPCSLFPPNTPCFESPNTKENFIVEEKYFTNLRILYECKYFDDCLTSGKKLP